MGLVEQEIVRPVCRGGARTAPVCRGGRGGEWPGWPALALAAIFATAAASGIATSQAPTPEMLENVVGSVVSVRVEREFRDEQFVGTGSGFFIHPDGFILTNANVVADRQIQRQGVEANSVNQFVVVDQGLPSERELPAEIVFRDQHRELALLYVEHRPPLYIDMSDVQETGVGQGVWSVGARSGDLLRSEARAEGHPDRGFAISRGVVTSLRRDAFGQLESFQTDAEVDSDSAGGPLVDAGGRLVGVSRSADSGEHGAGSGVSANRIRDFLRRQSVHIEFSPGMVHSPPQPIRVVVEPILLVSGLDRGEVRFEGDDIKPVSYALEPVEGKEGPWTATIEASNRIAGRQRPEKYFAEITLYPRGSEQKIRRRFALRASPEHVGTAMSGHDPARMMSARQTPTVEIRRGSVGADKRKRISDIAGSVQINRDDTGSVVIDQQLVKEVGAVAIDPNRFKRIKDEQLRREAIKYDRLAMDIAVLVKSQRTASMANDYASWEYALELHNRLSDMRVQKSELARILRTNRIRWCPDLRVYFEADGQRAYYPCSGQTLY